MSKGLHDAGFDIVGAIDIWDKAVDNYRLNFSTPAICADLTSLSPEEYDSTYITNKEHQLIDLMVSPSVPQPPQPLGPTQMAQPLVTHARALRPGHAPARTA